MEKEHLLIKTDNNEITVHFDLIFILIMVRHLKHTRWYIDFESTGRYVYFELSNKIQDETCKYTKWDIYLEPTRWYIYFKHLNWNVYFQHTEWKVFWVYRPIRLIWAGEIKRLKHIRDTFIWDETFIFIIRGITFKYTYRERYVNIQSERFILTVQDEIFKYIKWDI